MIAEHSSNAIRVLVAEASPFMRTALSRMITSDPELVVAATAQNGPETLRSALTSAPDVVVLDVDMPQMSGLEILAKIAAESAVPVIMVSSLKQRATDVGFECVSSGAFDYLCTQVSCASMDIVQIRDELISRIKLAARSRAVLPRRMPECVVPPQPLGNSAREATAGLVAIGISTGGPKALQQMLPKLPADLPVGVLIVQHMPAGFTGPFAERLNRLCEIKVREAADRDRVETGVVYLAPAGWHMTIRRTTPVSVGIQLSRSPADSLHIPSVDVMMSSVAEVYRSAAMGIIMTGMGSDGLVGMKAIADAGGITLGQDESSCTVYGMPRSCAEAGIVQRVASLDNIPGEILQAVRYRRAKPAVAR